MLSAALVLEVLQAAACGGDTVPQNTAPLDASVEASPDGGREVGPSCPIPIPIPPKRKLDERILGFFSSERDVAVWYTSLTTEVHEVGAGKVQLFAFEPEVEARRPRYADNGTAFWVDDEAVYAAGVSRVERFDRIARRDLGLVPEPFVLSALVADRSQVIALLAQRPCIPQGATTTCAQRPGLAIAARPVTESGEWVVLAAEADALRPSTPKGELALDDRNVYYLSGATNGAVAIRAVAKSGGSPRTLLEAKPESDAGATDAGVAGGGSRCSLPDVCIDADVSVHGDSAYWRGAGAVYAMKLAGGSPLLLAGNADREVTAYAVDGDELFTIELDRNGQASVLRRSLSALEAPPKVITTQRYTARRSLSRDTALGVGSTTIFVSGLSEPNEILAFCRAR